jgi:uncharacterized membrane protein YbhN (UPF0104 family)
MWLKNKWIVLFLKLTITAVVMLLVVERVNFKEIDSAFRNPQNPLFIVLAVILLFPNLFIQWYRWHFLLRLLQKDVPVSESISSFFGGQVVGFVTPGRIGELGRSLFLKQIDRLQAIGLLIIDKFYAFLLILTGGLWGIIVLICYLFNYSTFIMIPLATAGVIIGLACIIIGLHPGWMRTFLYHISIFLPARDKLRQLISCMDQFKRMEARKFFIYTILFYCIFIVQFCLLAFAFQKTSWTTALTATTATILAKTLLPVSIADLGIREGASVFFFLKFHVEKVTAFNSSILLFAINILIPTFIGLFFLPRLTWKNTK